VLTVIIYLAKQWIELRLESCRDRVGGATSSVAFSSRVPSDIPLLVFASLPWRL